jgi:hypothetical protein
MRQRMMNAKKRVEGDLLRVGVYYLDTEEFTPDPLLVGFKKDWNTDLRGQFQSEGWYPEMISPPWSFEKKGYAKVPEGIRKKYDYIAVLSDNRKREHALGNQRWEQLGNLRNRVVSFSKEHGLYREGSTPRERFETIFESPSLKLRSNNGYIKLIEPLILPATILSPKDEEKRRKKYRDKGKPYKPPKPVKTGNISLFTATGKMSCMSFSLPAGPADKKTAGTCSAAVESVVSGLEGREKGFDEEQHQTLVGRGQEKTYICDICYAGKNNYLLYRTISITQKFRHEWTKLAIGTDPEMSPLPKGKERVRQEPLLDFDKETGELLHPVKLYTFFETEVVRALSHLQKRKVSERLMEKAIDTRFFRVHDAGDFFDVSYYRAWCRIAAYFNWKLDESTGEWVKRRGRERMIFWAPTRQWVFSDWRDQFVEYPPPPNFSIRPSGLFVKSNAPTIEALASGSMSIPADPEVVFQCPAYQGSNATTCMANIPHSKAERAKKRGEVAEPQVCRHCWVKPESEVNYWTH